jgi:hypothetical protein
VKFFKGKTEAAADEKPAFEPQPDKAAKFFQHAKAKADSSGYAYALELYASGLKLDPESMTAHEAMYETAIRYNQTEGKPASRSEVKKFDDGTPVGRFVAAVFNWMKNLADAKSAMAAVEAAGKAEMVEWGHWAAPKAMNLLLRQKKLSKGVLVQATDIFQSVEAWDQAYQLIQKAAELDPSDNDLVAQAKNLAAQRAMEAGGYERDAGQQGSFRGSIRDAEKQRELIEEESISGGQTVEERNLARAKEMYEAEPSSPDAINRYAQLLRKQGTPAARQEAHDLYLKGYEATNEYRFRMLAGDIEIDQLERAIERLDGELEKTPDDEALKAEREETNTKLLELKASEYGERVKLYPTDRFRKFDLGMIEYELGHFDSAMAQFQASKDEPKLRARAGHMLGRCFLAEQWYAEAIAELEETLKSVEATDSDRELAIKYDLMLALLSAAQDEQNIDHARQAKSICSEIARRNITYRDIRAKRKEVDEVIKGLSGD